MDVTVAQAQTMDCENCNAKPGEPCTQPTDTSRKPVAWVHLTREEAYRTMMRKVKAEAAFRDILSGLPDA